MGGVGNNFNVGGEFLYVSWYNMIKICRLKFKDDSKI